MAKTFTFDFSKRAEFGFSTRLGEEKWHEQWVFGEEEGVAEVLVLGISEDHGPQANFGLPGSAAGFKECIGKWGNMAFHDRMPQQKIRILGDIQQNRPFQLEDRDGKTVEELDELVLSILEKYHHSSQLIVIGGGHNNALPIIRHFKKKWGNVHSVNIDPHADCRSTETRHSGNAFSTAILEGSLNSYWPIGLHMPYNNAFIHAFFKEHQISPIYHENAIEDYDGFLSQIDRAMEFLPPEIGLDIDLDSIAMMPSSAFTPSGLQLNQVRQLLRRIARRKKVQWLHLPEGAPSNDSEMAFYSKSVAYLIYDYLASSNSTEDVLTNGM